MRLHAPLRVTSAIVLLLGAALAGCFEEDVSDAPAPVAQTDTGLEVGENATGGLGALETDATVEGVGGRAHIHDYWEGRNKVVIFAGNVYSSILPVVPDQDVSNGVFMARHSLPWGTLVYEGAGKLEILVTTPDNPTLQGLRMRYRAPNMEEWSEKLALAFDSPLEIALTPEMTDMPHAAGSLWQWEYFSDGPAKPLWGSFNLTITVYKARDVEAWPGHPDFYKGKTHRVILENAEWKTQHAGFEDIAFQDQYIYGFLSPDLLVSMGTDHVWVFVNVTEINTPFERGPWYLEYHNATQSDTFVRYADENSTDDFLLFQVPVDEGGHDSPYGTKSRWGFKLRVFTGAVITCNTCFAYELKYTVSIVAYPPPANATLEDENDAGPRADAAIGAGAAGATGPSADPRAGLAPARPAPLRSPGIHARTA